MRLSRHSGVDSPRLAARGQEVYRGGFRAHSLNLAAQNPLHLASSLPRIRPRTLVGLLAVGLAIAAAVSCGDSGQDSTGPVTTSEPPATTATPTETGGIDPLEGASTAPVTGEPQGDEIALVERIDLARHEGFDRVVFRFRNAVPGYRIEYVEPPLREDGSGALVRVEGEAFVLVRMEPASGFDLSVPEGELVYKGPRRISGADAGTSVVRELVRTGDFEAVLSWAVGLSDRVDFRVLTLQDPPRLVVDFRNH